MNCPKCGSVTRTQVQAVISAPGEMNHRLSKRNLRSKDVYFMAVLWETADFICTNVECQYIHTRYGNYVTRLAKENKHLLAVAGAAGKVLEAWERGDLAGAVRSLDVALDQLEKQT